MNDGNTVCRRSRYSETFANLPPKKAQACEYADPWHPAGAKLRIHECSNDE